MFNQIFNSENFFFRGVSKFMDIVGLSVVYLVFCLPVVTIGPATAALYYSAVKCVRRGEEHPYRNFWQSFRSNWRVGAIVTLPCLAVGAFLVWEYGAIYHMAAQGDRIAAALYVALVLLLILPVGFLCWLFPLLSRFESGPGELLWMAFQFTIRYLPTTTVLAVLNYLIFVTTIRFWFLLPMAVAPVLSALLSSVFLERVLKKVTPGMEGEGDKPWYLK